MAEALTARFVWLGPGHSKNTRFRTCSALFVRWHTDPRYGASSLGANCRKGRSGIGE